MPRRILESIVKYIDKYVDLCPKSRVRRWHNTSEIIEYIKRKMYYVQNTLNDTCPSCVVLIHSVDMGVLKGSEWQEMLGELATCKKLRFVVTVDNAKSGVLFTD